LMLTPKEPHPCGIHVVSTTWLGHPRCSYVLSRVVFGSAGGRAWVAEGGQDREGPLAVEGRLLSGHGFSRPGGIPGAAGRSWGGQRVRQPFRGPGRPRAEGGRGPGRSGSG